MNGSILRTLGALVSASTLAAAQGAGGAAQQFFATLDANHDGFISRAEWHGSGATFLGADADLDGYLTLEELANMSAPPAARPPAAAPAAPQAIDPKLVDALPVAIRELRDPPEAFTQHCTACHNTDRIVRAQKNSTGWAQTVSRMRQKKEAKISEKEARIVVDYLDGLRAAIAKADVEYGSDDPRRDWGLVIGGGDLQRFDRDHNGKLDGGELGRLVFERVDLDDGGSLSFGEFSLLPLAADRRALFLKLDRDHNGELSLRELGIPTGLLDLADENHDGALELKELPRSRVFGGPYTMLLAADAKTALEILDLNHDGRLSNKELERFPGVLNRFDENKSGELEMKEIESAVTAARAEAPYAAFDDFFTRYDLDGNGSVSRIEFPGSDALFARLDLDGDGEIGAKEAPPGVHRVDFSTEAQRWR